MNELLIHPSKGLYTSDHAQHKIYETPKSNCKALYLRDIQSSWEGHHEQYKTESKKYRCVRNFVFSVFKLYLESNHQSPPPLASSSCHHLLASSLACLQLPLTHFISVAQKSC